MPTPSLRILLKDNIHPDPEAMRLCIDAGIAHLAISLHLTADNSMVGYEFYSFPDSRNNAAEMGSSLTESPLTVIRVGRVSVVYNTPDTVLVPDEIYRTDLVEAYMDSVHGDLTTGTNLLQEQLSEEGMWNLYRTPLWIQQELNLRFRPAEFIHVHSGMLGSIRKKQEGLPDTCLHLWFYQGFAVALLMKSSQVIFLQSIPYDIPEDLTYAVLNACDRYGMEPIDLPVLVSGLIDSDSVVYRELQRYFTSVEPDNGGVRFAQNDFFSSYPAHYFSPAFQLCACVS
jgi:hypothetical protein